MCYKDNHSSVPMPHLLPFAPPDWNWAKPPPDLTFPIEDWTLEAFEPLATPEEPKPAPLGLAAAPDDWSVEKEEPFETFPNEDWTDAPDEPLEMFCIFLSFGAEAVKMCKRI